MAMEKKHIKLNPIEYDLHHFCRQGALPLIRKRLHPQSINQKDAQGRTPLMICCEYYQSDVLKFLLDVGADPNLQNVWGETGLMIAVKKNNLRAIDLLLEYKAKTNLINNDGMNAHQLACLYGNRESAQKLMPESPFTIKRQFQSMLHLILNKNRRNLPEQ
jgi:uncharacterized protein